MADLEPIDDQGPKLYRKSRAKMKKESPYDALPESGNIEDRRGEAPVAKDQSRVPQGKAKED
jgi:hypothetical protein